MGEEWVWGKLCNMYEPFRPFPRFLMPRRILNLIELLG